MRPPRTRRSAVIVASCLAALTVMLAVAAPALAARPFIHAHRGGSLDSATRTFGENTLPAFATRPPRLRAGARREAHAR